MSLSMEDILRKAYPLLPVLVIEDVETAVPIAQALQAGGLNAIEVTLRTEDALKAVRRIRKDVPDLLVGVGTVTCPTQLAKAKKAGAQFAVSPGFNKVLGKEAHILEIPFLPGVMTPSEVMKALAQGFKSFKLFPADAINGLELLKSLQGPFADLHFCPTGGINRSNLLSYLSLSNVSCCGGSWLVPDKLVQAKDWEQITTLAREACALAGRMEL